MTKSKILIIGATGYIGKFVAQASIALHHPTYVLVRPSSISAKSELIDSFKASGITIVEGSLEEHDSLVAAIKQVDVVISTVGGAQTMDQLKIIAAIKEVGTIKRFFPSEFGLDADRAEPLEPFKSALNMKVIIRRAVEEAQIPYTYLCSNAFGEYILSNLIQPELTSPPRDKVIIYGDGNAKAIFVLEEDIGTYTVKAVDDPRTLNKTLHLRPPANIISQNELVAFWETKIGKTLEKVFLSVEELVKKLESTPFPGNFMTAIIHEMCAKGGLTNFDLGPQDVEASALYPEVKYTSVDEYLGKFV